MTQETLEKIRAFIAAGQALLDGGELPDFVAEQVNRALLMVEVLVEICIQSKDASG